MPNPSHHQTNQSQFADDACQWAVNINLAAEYLQRDLDKLARWCAKWRIKLSPEKTKVIIFSKSPTAISRTWFIFIRRPSLVHPHIKFLGITFDSRMTFVKDFEKILERCNQKFRRLRILVNNKWGPSPTAISQIYKQCVRPIFEYRIVSAITVSDIVIKNTKSPELFHQASTSPCKVCVGSPITRGLRAPICNRETYHSRPKSLS